LFLTAFLPVKLQSAGFAAMALFIRFIQIYAEDAGGASLANLFYNVLFFKN